MPFSSNPVYVGNGDTIQIRYPTPSTWNTSVTVDIQIGTGFDEEGGDGDGVTFSTKIPNVNVTQFSFNDQQGYAAQATISNGNVSVGSTLTTFLPSTRYYSNVVELDGFEIPLDADVSATSNGPLGNNANTTARFRILRNGSFGNWRTSISADLDDLSTGVQPGDKIQLRVDVPASYVTTQAVTFTVSDTNIPGKTWPVDTEVTDTWNFTSRAQDQQPSAFSFQDRVDEVPYNVATENRSTGIQYYYKYVDIETRPITSSDTTGIDYDAVLRCRTTNNLQVYLDQGSTLNSYLNLPSSGWTSNTGNTVVAGDRLWFRLPVGTGFTNKRTGSVTLDSVGGATYSRGGNNYENVSAGTFGTGDYAVTQTLGTFTNDWQIWTEVDRYPNAIDTATNASQVYTYGVKFDISSAGTGYVLNQEYTTTTLTGSGSGLKLKLVAGGQVNDAPSYILGSSGIKDNIQVTDPGYGYSVGDQIRVNGGSTNVTLTFAEYQKVYVTSDGSFSATTEPGFMYFTDFNVNGLGTEYPSGTYSDLTNGANGLITTVAQAQEYANALNGDTVRLEAQCVGGNGLIRKNNTGNWVNVISVENGDVINFKMPSDNNYNGVNTATIELLGPPQPPPDQNLPTGGPSPSYDNKDVTITLTTRGVRQLPFPFHATPVFLSNPLQQHTAEVKITGIDIGQQVTVRRIGTTVGGVSTSPSGPFLASTTFALNQVYDESILYVRTEASEVSGGVTEFQYQFVADDGSVMNDVFRVYTREFSEEQGNAPNRAVSGGSVGYSNVFIPSYAQSGFYVTLVGAGGGNGGCDAPVSVGGGGQSGELIKVRLSLTDDDWVTTSGSGAVNRIIRVYAGSKGEDGVDFTSGGAGGAGGTGFLEGGDGGQAGPGTAAEPGDRSGGGGGGGGATGVTLEDGTVLAWAGGGGGGAGAGNDTLPPEDDEHGNGTGSLIQSGVQSNFSFNGENGANNTTVGGGGGGAGGGFIGGGGGLKTTPDQFGNTDMDGLGGRAGGAYVNTAYGQLIGSNILAQRGSGPGEHGAAYIEYDLQDVDPILIGDYSPVDADINSTVESVDFVQVTDITGTINVTTVAGGWSVRVSVGESADGVNFQWQPFANSANVTNNQYVRLEGTTGPDYNYPYTATILFNTTEKTWTVNTGAVPDDTPNAFSFAPLFNQEKSTLVFSELTDPISGLSVPAAVQLGSNTELNINGTSTWYSSTDTIPGIVNGDVLQLRLTTSDQYNTAVFGTITVGSGDEVTWTVTTRKEGLNFPEGFIFLPATDIDLETPVTSNVVQIDKIDEPIDFIVEAHPTDDEPENPATAELPRIYLNSVLQPEGVTQVTVEDGDFIALYYVTSDVIGEPRVFKTKTGLSDSTLGYYETNWEVTNAGTFGTTPDEFTFNNVVVDPGTFGVASEVPTISGLSPNSTVVNIFTTNGLQVRKGTNGQQPSGSFVEVPFGGTTVLSVRNGDRIEVRLQASIIPGLPRTGAISVGGYTTTFTVLASAEVQDPILGQWYSSVQSIIYQEISGNQEQIRFNHKFDGLPIGSMIPVFQDATEDDGWGILNGNINSRFHGWLYCDGDTYNPEEYPQLFSAIGYTYGAVEVLPGVQYFKIPDMRNRYVKGVGPVDGTQLSSPSLSPTFGPNKAPGNVGNDTPGASGGSWFVDTIADPGTAELEQIETPPIGLEPTESQFFGIAQIQTNGYTNVSGIVEFSTEGQCGVTVRLDDEPLYEVPSHTHSVIMGQADPGNFKGAIYWGQEGGRRSPIFTDAPLDQQQSGPYQAPASAIVNMWGYPTGDTVDAPSDNLPDSVLCPGNSVWWDGTVTEWSESSGYEGVSQIGDHGDQTFTFGELGGAPLNEIRQFLNVDVMGSSDQGNIGNNNVWRQLAAIDIPRKQTFFRQYTPTTRMDHTHYLSNVQIDQDTNLGPLYAFGNVVGGGTKNQSLVTFEQLLPDGVNLDTNVDLTYSASEIGITVLPGTFTLQATKQIIPTPSLQARDKVAVMSPYTWVKWVIKAF